MLESYKDAFTKGIHWYKEGVAKYYLAVDNLVNFLQECHLPVALWMVSGLMRAMHNITPFLILFFFFFSFCKETVESFVKDIYLK